MAADVLARRPTPAGPFRAHATAAHGRDRCRPSPRGKRGSRQSRTRGAHVRACGVARARRQPRTVRAGPGRWSEPSGAASGRRVEGGRGRVGRSVGWVEPGPDDAAPRRRRRADATQETKAKAPPGSIALASRTRRATRAALIPPRQPTRGPAPVASGGGHRELTLASAARAPSLETRAICFSFLTGHVVTCKVASVYDGRTR
jgi:hypothetical protein